MFWVWSIQQNFLFTALVKYHFFISNYWYLKVNLLAPGIWDTESGLYNIIYWKYDPLDQSDTPSNWYSGGRGIWS